MILVRSIFKAKYGRGDELVSLLKEAHGVISDKYVRSYRILTDVSGDFFTIVLEITVDDLAAWDAMLAEQFTIPQFDNWFARMAPLVYAGSREFFRIEN